MYFWFKKSSKTSFMCVLLLGPTALNEEIESLFWTRPVWVSVCMKRREGGGWCNLWREEKGGVRESEHREMHLTFEWYVQSVHFRIF